MREAVQLDVCAEVGDGPICYLRVLAHELLRLKGFALLQYLGGVLVGCC